MRDRGPTEPECIVYGANGLLTWAFRLAGSLDLYKASTTDERQSIREEPDPHRIARMARPVIDRAGAADNLLGVANDLGAAISDLSASTVSPTYLERITRDIASRIVDGQPSHSVDVHTYTYRPENMTDLMVQKGFQNIVTGPEGCLILDLEAEPVSPIYRLEQGVFETVAWKPNA
jgi:hypothetical protein